MGGPVDGTAALRVLYYSARWRLGAYCLDPAGGPKFEVTPLVLTLFSCFKKIHFTPTRRQKDSNFKPK